jgi:lipopolysaccharide assembly outer membrane protein LptD (OstA)/preprotein translocase subunit YajC
MRKKYFLFFGITLPIILFNFLIFSDNIFAAESKLPIVVDGDHVEYFNEENKIIAKGHVKINYKDTKLTADKVVVYSQTKNIIAEGNVKLVYEKGQLEGEKILYNFEEKTGSIIEANIDIEPFFVKSPIVKKLGERELTMRRGYLTTCDLYKPHWRIVAKKVEMYPEDRVVAKDASFLIGNWPLITLPQYVQVLNDRRPRVTVIPGSDKNWGYYVLTAWRYYFNEGFKGRLHLDYRERKDLAEGLDLAYKPKDMGEGLLRFYYMNERAIQSRHIWDKDRMTQERERFRVQWRHKWQINDNTNLLWDYNKMKDVDFLKDYFRREYEKDMDPKTYAQFTHAQSFYSLNVLAEKRVNRFASDVEKLPQIKFETVNFRLGESRLYFQDSTEFANLINQTANQSTQDDYVSRFDTFNKFTYPAKIAFLNISPFVSSRQTYYSDDLNQNKDLLRSIFSSGIDISTRFFRVYQVNGKFLGDEIKGLRHVINPTIQYSYVHEPTIVSSKLYNFDSIDSIGKSNSAGLGIENKLQTKRKGQSVDLLSHILSSDFIFKGGGLNGRFSDILKSKLEIRPKEGLRLEVDTDINRIRNQIVVNNTDFYIDKGDKFSLGVGHRYQVDADNQFTFDINYRLNPKWKFRVYQRFDFTGGGNKEQQYIISRDLHCWTMEAAYHVDRAQGETIWLAFKVKAFPELGFEFDTSYHEPKAGSQSY